MTKCLTLAGIGFYKGISTYWSKQTYLMAFLGKSTSIKTSKPEINYRKIAWKPGMSVESAIFFMHLLYMW